MRQRGAESVKRTTTAPTPRAATATGPRVEQLTIRPGRSDVVLAGLWLVQAVVPIFTGDTPALMIAFFVVAALGSLFHYFFYGITITHDVVVVRRGVLQDIYRTEDFLVGHSGGNHSLMIGTAKVKFGFSVRTALIIETICELQGVDVPARFAIHPKPKTESFFHGRVRGLL